MEKSPLFRRTVLAWALYDCANSAFAACVIAVFFPIFYDVLSADAGLSPRDSQFWFTITLSASSTLLAIAAPLLGAIADKPRHGSAGGTQRKKYLAAFALLGTLMCAALAWVQVGMWWVGLLLYALASLGYSGANIFYDALLMRVADKREYDLVSAYGYALGYFSGGVVLALGALMVAQPHWFGFADARAALSSTFIIAAVWWAAFSIPLFLFVRESPNAANSNTPSPTHRVHLRTTLAQLRRTSKMLWRMKTPLLFLLAYWFYIDGVYTVFKIAVFFGRSVLDLPQKSLIFALLVTQFVAFPAALGFGYLGAKISARRAILFGLAVYGAVILYAWRWLDSAADFYLLAIAIGLVQGGVQSLSRALFAHLAPVNYLADGGSGNGDSSSGSAEWFGFFNMVGRFAAIFGPLLLAFTPIAIPSASARDSILALLALFVIGGVLLARVQIPPHRQE